MEYKISEVVTKTNVPKSTILYYIKEGLLPEANKVKANVHKYSDEHIELIRYIKYMQESLGSSIEEIKLALEKKNDSFSGSYTMLAPLMNTLSGEGGYEQYEKATFIEHFDIDIILLDQLLSDGIINPIHKDKFTKKDATIISLVEHFIEVGLSFDILKAYLRHAKQLAELEQKMQEKLCDVKTEDNFSLLWKIMFDTLFNAKEYVFNRSTYKILHSALQDEIHQ